MTQHPDRWSDGYHQDNIFAFRQTVDAFYQTDGADPVPRALFAAPLGDVALGKVPFEPVQVPGWDWEISVPRPAEDLAGFPPGHISLQQGFETPPAR